MLEKIKEQGQQVRQEHEKQIPDYARCVVIPVANPATAPHLLQLGTSLIHPDEGRVIALIVTLGDAEAEARSIESLNPIVQEFQEAGYPVELVTDISTSVARGILDTVREQRADMVIVGVRQPVHGEVVLGAIAESVATTAPCDVLIYRAAPNPNYERVMVWANGSQAARVAANIGVLLGKNRDKDNREKKVEGIIVQSSGRSYWQGRARIEHTLEDIPGAEKVKRTVVTAQELTAGLLTRVTENDLLVIGFSRRTELEKWLFGDFTRQVLNRAPGPVILTSRITAQDGRHVRLKNRFSWLMPTLTRIEQDEIVRQAHELSAPALDYVVLILVSALIASLGLLLNSAAVIIGAMLIAPLMQPLSAFSTGMVTGNIDLLRRASWTLLVGVMSALLLATFTGWIIPVDAPTTEMLSRGSPTLLDAVVALASGFIGAYATARKGIPAALAGVAIAAALMPPLCTVGLGIASDNQELATGAALLFLMNIAYISLAGWAVFFWLGMRPHWVTKSAYRRYISLFTIIILALPVMVILRSLRNEATDQHIIQEQLDNIFSPAEVVQLEVDSDSDTTLHVTATLRTSDYISSRDVQSAEQQLEEKLNQDITLEVVVWRVIKPPDTDGE